MGDYMREALRRLDAIGRPAVWTDFATFPIVRSDGKRSHMNVFRYLKKRGLVADTTNPYRPGEPWDGPRPSLYVLTPEGRLFAGLPLQGGGSQ